MSREWKPGDVAAVTIQGGSEQVAVLVGHDPERRCWHSARSNGDLRCADADAVMARPLVVIDPDGDLEPLWLALRDGRALQSRQHLAAALRSLVADPKPDEPQGLGAVVEDAEGWRYTRYDLHDRQPWWWNAGGPDKPVVRRFAYADITAVRVLSEGVTP